MNHLSTNPASSIFTALCGKWSIDRQIMDKLTNLTAKVYGVATFSNESNNNKNVLIYQENVKVKWQNSSEIHSASKKYKYLLSDDNKIITQFNSIYGLDGKIDFEKMYDLNFYFDESKNALCANGEFQCGPDLYKANYEFDNSLEKFKLFYEAKGNSKNFYTVTTFSKSLCVAE